jgi:hypothetical protein
VIILGLYRVIAFIVVCGLMAAAVVIMAAAWLGVILIGLIHPRLSPRRACDGLIAFLHESVQLVRSLDPR